MSAASRFFFLLGALVLWAIARSHRRLARALSRELPALKPLPVYPSVTVIRPIRGLDVGARENILALLDSAYPGELEILCILDSKDDPAYPLVSELIQSRRSNPRTRAAVLLADAPPPGRTGKLNAMLLGAREAKGELIAFSDSDTRPRADLLSKLVELLLSGPRIGAVFAPIVAVVDSPTVGDVGYALLVNAWYSPAVALVAGTQGELPFIMGQMMVFKREALEAIGGVGCAEGQLVDDMFIGKRVSEAGWLNVVSSRSVPIIIGRMGLLQFLFTFRRWVLFSQGGLPRDFTRLNWIRGILAWMAWVGLAGALASGHAAAAVLMAAAIAAFAASQLLLQRRWGGPRVAVRHWWIPAVLPLVAALVALSTRIWRTVDWRGRRYTLERGARLGSGSPGRS